eukprot:4856703-Prymnesium_polylepis.2
MSLAPKSVDNSSDIRDKLPRPGTTLLSTQIQTRMLEIFDRDISVGLTDAYRSHVAGSLDLSPSRCSKPDLPVPPQTARPALTLPPVSNSPQPLPSVEGRKMYMVMTARTIAFAHRARHAPPTRWLGPLPDGREGGQVLTDLSRLLELPPSVLVATERFVDRHKKLVSDTSEVFRQLVRQPGAVRAAQRFERGLDDVQRNRLYDDVPRE